MTIDDETLRSIHLANGRVVTAEGIIEGGHLLTEAGQISALRGDEIATDGPVRRIDASGLWVIPGLIDLHTHGLRGYDNMGTGLSGAIQAYPSVGVTGFLATTVTAPAQQISSSLGEMASILADPPPGAACLGIHLEGPYLSPNQAGMANPDWCLPFSLEQVDEWRKAANGQLKLITLAPEILDELDLIGALTARGLIVSAGHTDASFDLMRAAVRAGISQATHTFNAMHPLHHRRPGAVGAILASDQIKAEVIGDGIHVDPEVISLLVRFKGVDKVLLVSDSAPMAGMPEGQYSWQDQAIFVANGRCQLEDATLAGAYQGLEAGLRTIINHTQFSIVEAVQMAAATPARALGLTDRGQLQPGMRADVVLLDDECRPVMTIIQGEISWIRPEFRPA